MVVERDMYESHKESVQHIANSCVPSNVGVMPATTHCSSCNENIPRSRFHGHLASLKHKKNACVDVAAGVEIVKTSFQRRIVSYRISSEQYHINYDMFFNELKDKALRIMDDAVTQFKAVKVNMEVFGVYIHQKQNVRDIKSFNTKYRILNEGLEAGELYNDMVDIMKTKASEFQERDSGKRNKAH